MSNAPYVPPKVWHDETTSGGEFAKINRPAAGPTHDKTLPVGKHPLQLYSLATPNGVKVTILLEELLALGLTDAEYDAWLIRIGDGDQFSSGFVEVNPNSKIPALLDRSVEPAQRVFESGSILLYLAEKFGKFLPTATAQRTEALNWLFWQMGAAPYLGGGFGHFYAYAPEKLEYPINRFTMEAKRQLDVLDRRLAESRYLAGDEYSIADIAVWPTGAPGWMSTKRPSSRALQWASVERSPGSPCRVEQMVLIRESTGCGSCSGKVGRIVNSSRISCMIRPSRELSS